jgi:hypothetical protein
MPIKQLLAGELAVASRDHHDGAGKRDDKFDRANCERRDGNC